MKQWIYNITWSIIIAIILIVLCIDFTTPIEEPQPQPIKPLKLTDKEKKGIENYLNQLK